MGVIFPRRDKQTCSDPINQLFSLSFLLNSLAIGTCVCVCLPVYSFRCNFACCQAERLQHGATSQFFAYFAENKLPRHNIK